mgnify:CR=1 FL=1
MRVLTTLCAAVLLFSVPVFADELILVGGGDVAYPTGWFSDLAAKKGRALFGGLTPYLKSADLRFLNLESPVTTRKTVVKKSYPMVMKPRFLRMLHSVGFNLFSLANNHTGDAGPEGVTDTLTLLQSLSTPQNPLHWAGAGLTVQSRATPAIFTDPRTGVRIAFLAFRLSGSKLGNPMGRRNAEKQIKAVSDKADFVVVSAHGGGEYKPVPGQWKARRWRAMIDAGAHVVLGHGPHNTQGVELYKHGVIYYSLGNFSFGTRPGKKRTGGMKLRGQLAKIGFSQGKVSSAKVLPLYVDNTTAWKLSRQTMPVRVFTPMPLTGLHFDAYLAELRTMSKAIKGNKTVIESCGEFYCLSAK